LIGTRYAVFLPAGRVVDFISEVLEWYREKADGLGRIRLGDVIIREGSDSLLLHLRNNFAEYLLTASTPPRSVENL
jgi:dissimilatory sulfite reductase (desulfoviridin) alpha/beta subunit